MPSDDATRALGEKYGRTVHPRLRGQAFEEVVAMAEAERRSINRQVEVLVDEALRARRGGGG
jgi:hypothetical protein